MSEAVTVVSLKNAGESITIGVESCKLMEIGKYPEVEFVGQDGSRSVAVRVNKQSADRQLARLGLDYASAAGKILTLSRSANPADASKPWWNINLAGTMPKANGKPPVQRTAIPDDLPEEPPPIEEAYSQTKPVIPPGLSDVFRLYDACLAHAQRVAYDGDVAAATATMFIEASKRGIKA